MKPITLAFCCFMTFSTSVFAQLETKSIAVFKDGNSFVFKQGNVETTNNQFILKGNVIPNGLFGTFWVASPFLSKATTIMDSVEVKSQQEASTLGEYLRLNQGKSAVVTFNDKTTVSGTIESVKLGNREVGKTTHWLEFKTNQNAYILVSSDKIEYIRLESKPETMIRDSAKSLVEVLTVSFTGNQKTYPLSMMYLNKGLSWTPFYLLDIKDESKANLTLRAEVINKNEDIINTTMSFVIGNPNFKYATKLTGLFFHKNVEQPYEAEQQIFRNNLLSSNSDYEENRLRATNDVDGNISPDNVEDLYYYPVKNFSMKRGERGHYPIFSHDVDIAHVFECNLNNNEDLVKNYNDYRFVPNNKNPVFHAIRILNNTNTPWTTAPIMMVKTATDAPKPIAQDMMSFTPKSGQVFVKITETPEIRVKQTEKEVARTPRSWNNYDLVTIECSVQVTNLKSKTADMCVRRRVFGKLLESDLTWKRQEFLAPNYNQINGMVTDVRWDFMVKNGEEKTFKYSYQVLVYNPH
jgi:hypothetical protein